MATTLPELNDKCQQLLTKLESGLQAQMTGLHSMTQEQIFIMLVELGRCLTETIAMLNTVDVKLCTSIDTLDEKLTAGINAVDEKLHTHAATVFYFPGPANSPTVLTPVVSVKTPPSPIVDVPIYTNTHSPVFVGAMPILTKFVQKLPGMITNSITGIFKQLYDVIDKLGIPEIPDSIKISPTENSEVTDTIADSTSTMSVEEIQAAELKDQYGI